MSNGKDKQMVAVRVTEYSAIKRNKQTIYAMAQLKLNTLVLSKRSQTQKGLALCYFTSAKF